MHPKNPSDPTGKIKVSSPLSILGVFVEILRQRFSEGVYSDPALTRYWKSDLADTGIFIEPGWDENVEARNTRPGLWVQIQQNYYKKVGIGNQDGMPVYKNVRLEQFYAIGTCSIRIDCTSKNQGESRLFASQTQDFLYMSAKVIEHYFGFRDIGVVAMQPTAKFEQDDTLFTTPIELEVEYEIRWATMPVATTLNQIALKLENEEDPDAYFRDLVIG